MRRVKHIMGIPISIDIPDVADAALFEIVFDRLHKIDAIFSTYKPDSILSRYRGGNQKPTKEILQIKHACEAYEQLTNGYFSAYYKGPFDPTGYVKGWAIQEVGDILWRNGIATFLINAAGDILAASDSKKIWTISLQDPFSRTKTLGIVTLKNGAIATSGTYERGQHIFDPHIKKPVEKLVSATVYGPEIITADVFATACIAMGNSKAIDFINNQPNYETILLDDQGTIFTSANPAA